MRMKWKVLFLFASAYIARSSRSSAETLFVLVIFIYRNDWKRTNKSIKQRNKQVMITSTNVVWRSRYSWLGDADACVYVCARCALASIAHVIALHHINIVWNRVLQLRVFSSYVRFKRTFFSHHMAMALEEFTGWFWYSRDLLVASSVEGLFIMIQKTDKKNEVQHGKFQSTHNFWTHHQLTSGISLYLLIEQIVCFQVF